MRHFAWFAKPKAFERASSPPIWMWHESCDVKPSWRRRVSVFKPPFTTSEVVCEWLIQKKKTSLVCCYHPIFPLPSSATCSNFRQTNRKKCMTAALARVVFDVAKHSSFYLLFVTRCMQISKPVYPTFRWYLGKI